MKGYLLFFRQSGFCLHHQENDRTQHYLQAIDDSLLEGQLFFNCFISSKEYPKQNGNADYKNDKSVHLTKLVLDKQKKNES
jgi:hypothetical protein